jgi:hypothetical protein
MTDTLDTPAYEPTRSSHVPDGAHELPSGNWVMLRDPKLLTRGDKKAMVKQANAEGLTAIDSGYVIYELLAAKLITNWSYPMPLPADDPGYLDALPIEDDTPLSELIEPARQLLFPSPVSPDDHGDPRSPTEASGE